ncbi:MAG: putative porin [Verrucomicrobiota bacterium]|nr:putative porin [Verrucomicrobiota bacterium]
MFIKKVTFIALAMSFTCGTMSIYAQDAGALLDLLVRKRLITDQEAEEVRAELTKEVSATSAGKWKLSTPITELELYGDIRLRYEIRNGTRPDDVPNEDDTLQRNRPRYRLRLGLRGTLIDDWFFGVRLETNTNPRSTNVTFGDDAGPFGKTSDGVNVGQAYLGYRGFHDITLTGGKMPNPLVTTLMVWDGDINPEGLSEQWKHSFNFSFGGGAVAESASSSDGKGVVATQTASEPFKLKIDVFANFAQFVYDDTNPENSIGPRPAVGGRLVPTADAFMLAWQLGAKFNFPKNFYFQIAPVVYNYTGNGDSFNVHFIGGEPGLSNSASIALNQTGINSLLVLEIPAEIGWKLGELPMRIFGDFAVNFNADERANAALHPTKGDQRYAYQIGVGIGQLKQKRDWQLNVFWQHQEQYSLDPNLVDSDIFDSRLNIEGVVVQAGYALSDAVTFNLTYGYGWRIDDALGTGGSADIAVNPMDQYQIFQADLSVKF